MPLIDITIFLDVDMFRVHHVIKTKFVCIVIMYLDNIILKYIHNNGIVQYANQYFHIIIYFVLFVIYAYS